jgi:hypothetical protein
MGGVRSPTGRDEVPPRLAHFRGTEIRLIKREPALHLHNLDYKTVETRMAKHLCKKCSLCGEPVMAGCFSMHCREKGDAGHLALEVMES